MLPEEFVLRMKAMLGEEEYKEFELSYDKPRKHGLRINPLKANAQEFLAKAHWNLKPVPWEANGYYYDEKLTPGKMAYHDAGVYYIQEPSAMAPAVYLGAQPGERVLDLCAAPGGKTTAIAAQMRGEGLLVANEIHPQRAKVLSENVERLGIGNALVVNESPQRLLEKFGCFFDCIMVDAPCSGEGLFRKQEDAYDQWSSDNVRMCAQRQDEILEAAYAMLLSGGTMVYSTCTFAPDEDEGSVSRLLAAHPDLSIVNVEKFDGMSDGSGVWAEEFAELGGAPVCEGIEHTIRLFPHKLSGEGHYVAVLKKAGVKSDFLDKGKRAGENWETFHEKRKTADLEVSYKEEKTTSLRDLKELSAFLSENQIALKEFVEGAYLLFGDQIYLTPNHMPSLKGLKVLRPGLHMGTLKKNRMEPSHALALYLHTNQVEKVCDLPVNDVRLGAYLHGETFFYEGVNGWYLICVDGYSIGWGKLVNNIMKNHYPKGLRI